MAPRSSHGIDVALVGRERPGDENLALRYLAAALDEAGHRAHLVPLCGPDDLAAAGDAVRRLDTPLVGLSISDGNVALDALALVRWLRHGDYRGHVTCGGPLATLVRHDILLRHPGIDSVVRHDGEVPLVGMADRLAAGLPCDDVAGVTTRRGDGKPAPVLDASPLHRRPRRAHPMPRILGVPVARLLASRGCPARCPYCAAAAVRREALGEGFRAGVAQETLDRRGVGGLRRRSPAEVAAEAGELFHRHGVRLFQLLDDNLLSGDRRAGAAWLDDLRRELAREGVENAAWCLQLDPALVGDETAAALADLGVVKVLLGVESLTSRGLAALGREPDPGTNLAAMRRLRERGIVTLFNTMIVHPGAVPAGIAAELDALETLEGVHFDVLPMAVHPGTPMWRDLCEDGRLSGGMLAWRFEPRDPVVARFRSALVRLRLEASGRYDAGLFAQDVALNLAMARRLRLPAYDPRLERELAGTVDRINGIRVSALRAALELAETETDAARRGRRLAALIVSLRRALDLTWRRIDHVQSALERAARTPRRRENLLIRSVLAAGFVISAAPQVACFQSHTSGTDAPAEGRDGVVDAPDDDAVAPEETDDRVPDTREDVADSVDGADDGVADLSADVDAPPDGTCTAEETGLDRAAAVTAMETSSCPRCDWSVDGGSDVPYGIVLDAEGRVVDVRLADGRPVPEDVRRCYLEALAGETFPCLAGDEIWQECWVIMF
ncbi:MAG: radical SAM protein [Deltaproteobacteria bacterium]|nr:radical SAM protein [Deltaproteobacteria bacterium]